MSRADSYALFVEGPVHATGPERETFTELWQVYLESLGALLPRVVVPIQKTHLIAMDPDCPKMSGASEPLDHLMARVIEEHQVDAAVIAWDLTPPWDPDAEEEQYCRWNETCKLYGCLAESSVLTPDWRTSCQVRADELAGRAQPSHRDAPFTLQPFAVVPICMEPEFEDLLAQDEGQILRALGLARRPPKRWPKRWGASGQNPKMLLQKAVVAARLTRPKPVMVKRIHGDMRTAKHEWGLHFLRSLLEHGNDLISDHRLSARIVEALSRSND